MIVRTYIQGLALPMVSGIHWGVQNILPPVVTHGGGPGGAGLGADRDGYPIPSWAKHTLRPSGLLHMMCPKQTTARVHTDWKPLTFPSARYIRAVTIVFSHKEEQSTTHFAVTRASKALC